MLLRKYIESGVNEDVAFINGIIQFRAMKLNVYSYVIDGIAIDAGSYSLRKAFSSFYEQQQIEALYCTHIHEDHTGCADWFQRKNIPIFIHSSSIEEANKAGSYPLYRRLFWGKRMAFKAGIAPDTFHSQKYQWKSIFTPGHSIDHLSYLNTSTGQLFSGDLFVQVKTKVIMDSESVPQIIGSIQKVLSYDFEDIYCNHAGFIANGKLKLQEKLDYLLQIQGEVQLLHKMGFSVKEIQQRLFPRKYPITTASCGQWDSKHIVTSILEEQNNKRSA